MNVLFGPLLARLQMLNLSKRFVVLSVCMIVLTVFSAQWFYARQSRTYMELRLKEKAAFINKFYSYVISGLLVRKDDIGLQQVINTLEEDQEISTVIVVDQNSRIRYHLDPQKVGQVIDDPLIKTALKSGQPIEDPFRNSGGQALALISPLKVPGSGRLLGAMRVDLTYHTIERQMASSGNRFWFITLGSIISCVGLMLTFLGAWVLMPLHRMRSAIDAVNPVKPELYLPESTDEIGQLYTAINAMVSRFTGELQTQVSHQSRREQQEKLWVQRLVNSFLPNSRVIVADKDNRVLSDTGNGPGAGVRHQHLLDLIKDGNFATLLTAAFQKEGDVVRGPVKFQNINYTAAILSVPMQQAVAVKTLIALQP